MTANGLHEALHDIFDEVARCNAGETEFHQADEYGQPGSYVAGANIAGLTRADAMPALGQV